MVGSDPSHFADNGYSIGIAGMQEDKGGHFYIPYGENSQDDYKSYIDPNSGAPALFGFEGIERLYLDKAGDISVSENTVSKGGVLQTLTKDKDYVCQFYTGTFYQDFTLKASVRTFTSMEWFRGLDNLTLQRDNDTLSIIVDIFCDAGGKSMRPLKAHMQAGGIFMTCRNMRIKSGARDII